MKLKFLLITSALAALCSCTQPGDATHSTQKGYRAAESFTELIGLEVRNHDNEKLGIVKYITADLVNARLVEVVVASSLKAGSTKALPPRALMLDIPRQVMVLDASRQKFSGAPEFDLSDFAGSSQRGPVARANRYFGLEPWFYTEGQTSRSNSKILRLGHVETLGNLIGMSIVSTEGKPIGRVTTMRTDLTKGQIVHVVVDQTGYGGSNRVVQPRALRFNAARNGLVLEERTDEIAGEPRFRWLNGSRTAYQEEAYVNRDVEADKGLHSKQSAREGIVRKSIPMEEGENFRDEQKTARIKQAIQADSSLSAHAKNVEVVTLHAQTTLRGHVNTIESKQRIGAIAMQAGRPENVSNLIEVRPH